MAKKALDPGSLILVTGANGFIGSHIVVLLLSEGYKVRGTVRSVSKLDVINEILRERGLLDGFEGVVVSEMAAENAFLGVVDGCSGIIHVASDLSRDPNPNNIIPVVEQGVRNALAAAAHTPSVKRFVLTASSVGAMQPEPNVRFTVDEGSYNETAIKAAWEPPPYEPARAGAVYAASKAQGEKAAWAFIKNEKPSFTFNTVLPSVNLGPILSPKQPGSSAAFVKLLYESNEMGYQMMMMVPPHYMVNVIDTARLHVTALLEDDVQNERLFACAEPFNYTKVVEVLREIDPKKMDYPPPPANDGHDLSSIPTARSEELLKRMGRPGFTPMKETLKEQFKL